MRGLRNDLTPVHAKLAPIRCTPADLEEEEDDAEPVLLRCAELQRLNISNSTAFGRPADVALKKCDHPGQNQQPVRTWPLQTCHRQWSSRKARAFRPVADDDSRPRAGEQSRPAVTAARDSGIGASISPTVRTPPTVPRVRALKHLMQVKNRCESYFPSTLVALSQGLCFGNSWSTLTTAALRSSPRSRWAEFVIPCLSSGSIEF